MSKPLFWVVWVNGEERKFYKRGAMRAFVAMHKALGHQVTQKAIGF